LVSAIASVPEFGIGPRSKLYGWLKALGMNPQGQQERNLGELVGRRARVTIRHEIRDDMVFNKVVDVLAPTSVRQQALPDEDTETRTDIPW
jgi:hypothetical protein